MTIASKLELITERICRIEETLTDNPHPEFICQVSHVLMCHTISDLDKLNCIKILYKHMAWPGGIMDPQESELLSSVYG